MGTLHEDQYAFMTVRHRILRMYQTICLEKIKTHILYSITYFPNIMPFMR
jgi:hypothetical protein